MILFINSGGALLVVENMSKKIARYFIKQAIICGEDEETYSYGFGDRFKFCVNVKN